MAACAGLNVHVHGAPERLAHLRAAARQDVEHPRGRARLHRQLGHPQRGQRRLLGGIEDHRAAGGQRRSDLPGHHQEREVPGQHEAGDARGLAHDEREVVVGLGRDAAVELVDQLGVPEEAVDGLGDVAGLAIEDGLAGVERLHHRQLAGVPGHQLGEPDQDALALARREARPAAVLEGAARAGDGEVHVGAAAGRHASEEVARGRVDGVEGGAREGGAERAGDEGAGGQRQPLGDGPVLVAGQKGHSAALPRPSDPMAATVARSTLTT